MRLVAFCFVAAFAIAAHAKSFPGAPLMSPDGNWQIVDDEVNGPSGFLTHALLLENRSTTSRRLILQYSRHVDASWSPSSRQIAITDYVGSDSSRALLFDIEETGEPVDVGEILQERYPRLRRLMTNHHAYVEVGRFVRGGWLRLHAHGYGEQSPDGFTRCFDISLDLRKTRTCP